MMRGSLFATSGIALILTLATPAAAQISIIEAQITAGELRVSGRTKSPNAPVTLDQVHQVIDGGEGDHGYLSSVRVRVR